MFDSKYETNDCEFLLILFCFGYFKIIGKQTKTLRLIDEIYN